MNLETLTTELETIGTVVSLDERNGKLYIALRDAVSSTTLAVDFLKIFVDMIHADYPAQETLCFDGNKLKAVFSNDEEHINDNEDYLTGITNL